MKLMAAWQNQTANACAKLRVGRMSFELAWAAMCPPLVAMLIALLVDALVESSMDENSATAAAGTLIPLMLCGMAILTALIYLGCRAVETFRSTAADKIRITLGISTAITLIVLAVAVTAQAERRQVSQAAEMAIFLYLPTLFICAALLWHAATLIRSSLRRGLMLGGFVVITALVEFLSVREMERNFEEGQFMSHSLLVALAFAIQLSVWSARKFNRH